MRLGIISLFPEMFSALQVGVTGRAITNGLVSLSHWNPRDFAVSSSKVSEYQYRAVDDRPYGGGPGMVMRVEPLREAIKAAKSVLGQAKVLHLSPQGQLLTQQALKKLVQEDSLIIVTSRYEGVDERLNAQIDQEWSIGDYVVSGGELPAMVLIDGLIRLIPGALGHQDSAEEDSFVNGLLDCPHYTRPENLDGNWVPSVLLTGNHKAIAQWRLKQALGRTWLRRPDLLEKRVLTPGEQQLLNDFIREYKEARGNFYEHNSTT